MKTLLLVLGFSIITSLAVDTTVVARSPIIVNILADDDYPPYSYVEHGKLKGLYIDLVRQAATQLSPEYQVKLTGVPWKRALQELENGNAFAVLPPYLHYESRPYINPYSVPLMVETVVTVCHRDIELESAVNGDKQHYPALQLGMNAGYLLLEEEYLNAIAKGRIALWENKSTRANLMKLLIKRLDCYVNDRRAIQFELRKIKRMSPDAAINDLVELDQISTQAAYIGYTNVNVSAFPYKDDFVVKMNQALKQVIGKDSQ